MSIEIHENQGRKQTLPPVTINSDDVRLQWREVLDNARRVDTIVTRYRKPMAVVIDYDAWLAVKPALDEWRRKRAIEEIAE